MTPYARLIWFQVIFGRLDLRHRKQAEGAVMAAAAVATAG